jgi:hypothetical protein
MASLVAPLDLGVDLMLTVTESIREGLRIIAEGAPCVTCGNTPKVGPTLRELAAETKTSTSTLSRFLHGSGIDSDTLDRLYEFVNARLPERVR